MKLDKNLNILILFSLSPLLMTTNYSKQIYYNVASVINTVGILFILCVSYNFYSRINTTREDTRVNGLIDKIVYEIHLRDMQNKIKEANNYPEKKKVTQMLTSYRIMIDIGYRLLMMNNPTQLDQLCEKYKCRLSQQFKTDIIQFRNLYVQFFNDPAGKGWDHLSAMKELICCSELDTFRDMIKSNISSIMDGNDIQYTNSTRQYEIWNTESQV